MKKDQVRIGNLYSAKVSGGVRLRAQVAPHGAAEPKAAKLPAPHVAPVAGDVGPGAAPAGEGEPGRKAASPRPPKPTPGRKGKRSQVRPTKGTKPAPRKRDPNRPMSGLDAAAKVLADKGEPMRVSDIVEAAAKKGLWKSKAGKTPEATVYAAIIREIRDKGVESRFVKKDRGLFAAASPGKGR